MSLQAYQKAQRNAEHPRDTEYRLFVQVTQALIEANKKGRSDLATLMDALDWNRRMWSTLAADCSNEGNQLPPALRAQFISLSLWVSRFSSEVARTDASLEPLIDVNKSIIAGLAQRPAA
ncbi:MAG: flagellar biosynthesis regulator FlaF [Alphaproteobacteria bacterium]|nr:flagellar biosynthesis regulator FlaF [Alphaproteobacteria bacterium]